MATTGATPGRNRPPRNPTGTQVDNGAKRRIGGTRAVTTSGEPYPRQVTGGDSDFSGTVNFINWNGPVNAVAPADTVDLEALLEAVSGGTVTASTKIITPARGVRCGSC